MTELAINGLGFRYPSKSNDSHASTSTAVLHNITLSFSPGEIVSLVGPSGCGKTTLLNLIAGLLKPSVGEIRRSGGLAEHRPRRTGYVFQTPSLIPWRTIRSNALFGAEIAESLTDEVCVKCDELLTSYGLGGFEDSFPSSVSGGMQQRVSIVRAVLSGSKIILLDEPFSNTDFVLRRELHRELSRLVVDEQLIAILVTHDIEEAVRIGNKVVVLSERPALVRAEIEVPLSREDRIKGGASLMKQLASYVEQVEAIFNSSAVSQNQPAPVPAVPT